MKFLVFQFVPLGLSILSSNKAEKGLSLPPLHFFTGYLHIKCPWSPFFSRLGRISSLSPCVSDAPTFNYLCGPSLGLLQYILVSCAEEPRPGHSTLDGAPPGWVKRKDLFLQLIGNTSSHRPGGCWLSLPLAHIGDSRQTGAHQEYINSH